MKRPIELCELKLIDFRFYKGWIGTYKTFGLRSMLTLVSPLLNTILNYKHRDCHLVIDTDSFPFSDGVSNYQPEVISDEKQPQERG